MELDLSDVNIQEAKPAGENPANFYFQTRQLEVKAEDLTGDLHKKDGWVLGVLLPSIQNITGIILFVRMPWITGQAGVLGALLILFLCKCTTFLTALSMSAIVTNGKIQSGGSYYILARSLGPSFGGSVGILFYLGLVSASAMYILGGVQTFIDTADFEIVSKGFDIRLLSIVLLLILWVVNMLLMKSIAKLTIGLLGIVTICLICMFIGIVSAESRSEDLPNDINGLSVDNLQENKYSQYDQGVSFHMLIAVFYPSVTGFMAGTNRSGFLENPQKAIPKGTILAIFTMFLVYGSFIVFFGGVCQRQALDDLAFAATIAWPTPILVGIGVIVSSIGCALISLNSAPQILSSIAKDNILPLKYFIQIQEALKLSSLLACLIVLIGSLDAVAPIITMFFLLFYGFINVASCLLSILDNPSWRPQWPFFHWSTALLGSILCFGIMIYITWWAACLSFILAGILYYYIDMRTQATNWGDGITGLRQQRAKKALLGVHPQKVLHVKNWKPQLLVLDFTSQDNTPKHPGLICLVQQLKKGNGLTIFGTCKVGQQNKHNFKKVKEATIGLYEYFRSKRLQVFSKVVLAKTAKRGMKTLIQSSGLGGLEPNSLVMAWPQYWQGQPLRAARFCKLADYAQKTGLAFISLKPAEAFEENQKKISSIDIWWFCYDGGLMCLLAYLLKKHRNWRDCLVRIFYVVLESEQTDRNTLDSLKQWITNYRMFSNVHTELVAVPPQALMQHHSRLKEQTKRKQKQFINKFSPMNILHQIEQNQLDLANQFLNQEKYSLENEMSVYGYKRQNTNVEDDGVLINRKISEFSREADLVITALPDKPVGQDPLEYLRFCECLTKGLPRVLLVKGTDNSVVTDLTQIMEWVCKLKKASNRYG